ncbi:hypothetical protein Gohar_016111, partial [Gossypium harknessii]|nr:hypothetical protein [Gossypium harknessii]
MVIALFYVSVCNYTPYTLPYNNYFRKCFTCLALNLMIYADDDYTAVSAPCVTGFQF